MSKSKNKDDSAPTEPLSARLRWWPIALSIGVVVFLGCLLGYRTVFSPDIGYHMATGRLFYEMGQFALEDTFSYSFAGQAIRYMPWLFGLVCYLVYHAGGTPALVGAKIVVTLISGRVALVAMPTGSGQDIMVLCGVAACIFSGLLLGSATSSWLLAFFEPRSFLPGGI
jgi:hypothetical protein